MGLTLTMTRCRSGSVVCAMTCLPPRHNLRQSIEDLGRLFDWNGWKFLDDATVLVEDKHDRFVLQAILSCNIIQIASHVESFRKLSPMFNRDGAQLAYHTRKPAV